jgi:hypothetical protein
LKQTDFDGSYSYSKIESVYLNKSNRIEVYPNPNETGLLKITTGNSNTYEVKLIDCLGRIIYESKLDYSISEIDLNGFDKGIFTLFISSPNSNSIHKIIYK